MQSVLIALSTLKSSASFLVIIAKLRVVAQISVTEVPEEVAIPVIVILKLAGIIEMPALVVVVVVVEYHQDRGFGQ